MFIFWPKLKISSATPSDIFFCKKSKLSILKNFEKVFIKDSNLFILLLKTSFRFKRHLKFLFGNVEYLHVKLSQRLLFQSKSFLWKKELSLPMSVTFLLGKKSFIEDMSVWDFNIHRKFWGLKDVVERKLKSCFDFSFILKNWGKKKEKKSNISFTFWPANEIFAFLEQKPTLGLFCISARSLWSVASVPIEGLFFLKHACRASNPCVYMLSESSYMI